MKERPILFSGPMVRAILEDRKTQTRRIVTPQPVFDGYWWSHKGYSSNGEESFREGMPFFGKCPYGAVRDLLWIRESWAPLSTFDTAELGYLYRADHHKGLEKKDGCQKWKPSIHMPRAASRITLQITGLKVERLQNISEADAQAEGCNESIILPGDQGSFVPEFSLLWCSINGPDSWSQNPWVWAIQFKRITQSS